MVSPSELAPEQLRALARLSQVPALRGHYLAGKTAVAFHVRHRVSRDLDLFGTVSTSGVGAVHRALIAALPDAEVLAISDVSVQLKLEAVPIDVVAYPYPLLEPPLEGPEGFAVAGQLDLATMKLAALVRRGLRRDFWDMHELLTTGGLDLGSALDAYRQRFGKAEPDLYHVLKALAYFEDAEHEPIYPAGLDPAHWQRIRSYFSIAAPEALRARLGTSRG